MSQLLMELYHEDDFDFASLVTYTSSDRSFSTASSSVQPYTPQSSGRSTPQTMVAPIDMGFDPSTGYELTTTPATTLDGYFPSDIKSEFPFSDGLLPATPNQKPLQPSQSMEFEHQHFLGSVQSHGAAVEFANPQVLHQYPFLDGLSSSPYHAPPPPYSVANIAYDVSNMWMCTGETPMPYLEKFESPALAPASIQQLPFDEVDSKPPSYLASNGRRRVCIEKVRAKSTALHRVQGGRVNAKRVRRADIGLVPPRTHKCEYPECAKIGRAYVRSEHLKRHIKTLHREDPDEGVIPCECCGKIFINRMDNYKSHLKLHINPEKTRTKHYPEAAAIVARIERETRPRTQKKKKNVEVKSMY